MRTLRSSCARSGATPGPCPRACSRGPSRMEGCSALLKPQWISAALSETPSWASAHVVSDHTSGRLGAFTMTTPKFLSHSVQTFQKPWISAALSETPSWAIASLQTRPRGTPRGLPWSQGFTRSAGRVSRALQQPSSSRVHVELNWIAMLRKFLRSRTLLGALRLGARQVVFEWLGSGDSDGAETSPTRSRSM